MTCIFHALCSRTFDTFLYWYFRTGSKDILDFGIQTYQNCFDVSKLCARINYFHFSIAIYFGTTYCQCTWFSLYNYFRFQIRFRFTFGVNLTNMINTCSSN